MKKFLILILILTSSQSLFAQISKDYNLKGDMALRQEDYYDALAWYGEGLDSCDIYSIKKLNLIWDLKESMRYGMRISMDKCFQCLTQKAEKNDAEAMKLLSNYFLRGMGTKIDLSLSEQWMEKATNILSPQKTTENNTASISVIPSTTINYSLESPSKTSKPIFAAYTASPTMPFGFMLGGYHENKKLGAYAKVLSNLRSKTSELTCNNSDIEGLIDESLFSHFTKKTRRNNLAISAGLLYPLNDRLSLSGGLGYGKREVYWEVAHYHMDTEKLYKKLWAHNIESSYRGVVAEIGAVYKFDKFIFLAGLSTLKLKDLDMYAGIGYSF